MNCIVVDDDLFSTKIIEGFIKRTHNLHFAGSFSSAINAVNLLNNPSIKKVDLIFLDIEMPEMTGIDFLKSLNDIPYIIICSSEEKYALESYEYDVVDYLLKPVRYGRFIKALGKVHERIGKKENWQKQQDREIFIKNNSSLVRLRYSDILWIESLDNYIVIKTFNDKFTSHHTMSSINNVLPCCFVRIHRSYTVNLDRIKSIEDNMVVFQTEKGDISIPIGKKYRKGLMDSINMIIT